jgi:hypothetical protein
MEEVAEGSFPTEANSFSMNEDVLEAVRQAEDNGAHGGT